MDMVAFGKPWVEIILHGDKDISQFWVTVTFLSWVHFLQRRQLRVFHSWMKWNEWKSTSLMFPSHIDKAEGTHISMMLDGF